MLAETRFLDKAIQLARKAANPSPNPRVGAVIVKNGKVIAEGWHEHAGGPHAEIIALRKAGKRAAGATLFVTLEPCNHTGKTPPCTAAIIQAGIAKVVIGMADPSKRAGGGAEFLKKAGMKVQFTGKKIEQACRELNPAWLKSLVSPLPFMTLKLALTTDDSTISPSKKKWITNAVSRQRVQDQRAEHDAIMVGVGTVIADDPHLTVRGAKKQPVRIILDPHGRMPETARLLREPGTTVVVTKKPVKLPRAENLVVAHFQLKTILRRLRKCGLMNIYVEGGATTAQHFVDKDLIDRIYLFQADPPRSYPQLFGQRFSARNTAKEVIKSDVLWDISLRDY